MENLKDVKYPTEFEHQMEKIDFKHFYLKIKILYVRTVVTLCDMIYMT